MTTDQSVRRMLDSDTRHQVMLLANTARILAEAPKPDPGESKNIVIPAHAAADAYTDMAVRLEAIRTLAIGPHQNNPHFAEIGLDVLVDVARYARARYETPITYTRDEQALAHSGRCKAYRDMAERLEALLPAPRPTTSWHDRFLERADALSQMARPMPTREQIAKAIHDQYSNHPWKSERCLESARNIRLRQADAVLALMNGAGA